jgi:hypothetical protein
LFGVGVEARRGVRGKVEGGEQGKRAGITKRGKLGSTGEKIGVIIEY